MSYLRIFVEDVFALLCALAVKGVQKLACVRIRKFKITAKNIISKISYLATFGNECCYIWRGTLS